MASSSSTSSKRTAMTSSESAASTIASSSSSTGTSGGESGSGFQVPLTHDNMTFGARQEVRLKEMEKKVDEELRKKRRDWNRDVARMREEVIQLLPTDRSNDSDETTLEPFIARRRGSTDCLDVRKMKTLFLEYPDGGRRCKLRFNVSGFDDDDIAVTTDGERIIVRATATPTDNDDIAVTTDGERIIVRATATPTDDDDIAVTTDGERIIVRATASPTDNDGWRREFVRKIEKPKEVDHTKLKSTLTTDGILVVEASMHPVTLNLRKSAAAGSQSPASSSRSSANYNGGGGGGSTASLPRSKSSSRAGSPAPPPPSICPRELLGVPVIRELDGRRRLSLVIDLGTTFTPKEITVFIIKESRLQVKARHEERTSERLSRSKFSKDYELPERVESYSVRAGLTADGKLMIAALVKGHAAGLSKHAAGDMIIDELNARSDNDLCNVLDLSSFPPTNIANSG